MQSCKKKKHSKKCLNHRTLILCSFHKLVITTKRRMDNAKHLRVKYCRNEKKFANGNFKKAYFHVNLEREF